MLVLYNIGIRIYYAAIWLASFFNNKAKLWLNGRKQQAFVRYDNSIWFHFASLGEFEQGRPVLEQMKLAYPDRPVVITFFSPSGYEVRKNTPLADAVYYLPLDTAGNAARFIKTINPSIAVFTKYEYWYHFFAQLYKRRVPLYIVSGIFRDGQVFFKWYGGTHRKMLKCVRHFFLQDEHSKHLLAGIGINNTTVSGDTRFDRVYANASNPKQLPEVEQFINGHKTMICGSTWPEDEKLLAELISLHPDHKFIFAPHELSIEKINRLAEMLPPDSAIKYSALALAEDGNNYQCLIIDNMGMLSSLYQYGNMAYIGGGFGVGIHNTLEAAAFGIPVIFGPNYSKFNEAKALISIGAGFTISNEAELIAIVEQLNTDEAYYAASCQQARQYVDTQKGATEKIVTYIQSTETA
ncbi:3-deoxy-D-manno-octulosonic acid transferase [Mucilaginibacter sp. JRF]|uniref:3-deoxy-D-manno-octulosonic acid transferase n=1 Tax=Mucilaginibacter sp. JRF TaxID=2780088 RepID=UPI00187ECF81|nr:glycosyltransferase N-terminal domain-containing protein [Mucilaginibacter sp. JRF]MBE9585734.1 3-deoxy-D-manno-octulosonic acid transferase [Mucilaginibacter sp. JRF]